MYIDLSHLGLNSVQASRFLESVIKRRSEDQESAQALSLLPPLSHKDQEWYEQAKRAVQSSFQAGGTAIRLLRTFSQAQRNGSFLSLLSDSRLLMDLTELDVANIRRDLSTLFDVIQLPFSTAMTTWVDNLAEASPYRAHIRYQNKMQRLTTLIILCEVFFNRQSAADASIIDRCSRRFSDAVHNYLCYVHHYIHTTPRDSESGSKVNHSGDGARMEGAQNVRGALNKLLKDNPL